MIRRTHKEVQPAVVCEVHLEQIDQGLNNLGAYPRALVLFRMRNAAIGLAWLPVLNGSISPQLLRNQLPAMGWPIWQQVMSNSQPQRPLPTASVVVCTRDRTTDLAQCLPGLQQLALQGYDVMVVDNCPSDDSSARLVASYPEIRYIYEHRPGLDVARNRGLREAKGEIVAFTDDDARVDAHWLPALLCNFEDPTVALVTGLTMPLELETAAQHWFEETNGFGRGFERRIFDSSTLEPLAAGRIGAGVNMAIRRSALDRVGLFDEALDGGSPSITGGDQEFFYRVLARGYRAVYEPAALVWHRHRREWSALRQTVFGYGVGVFAWWTRALLVEGELVVLKNGPLWFWQHHVKNVIAAALRRPRSMPLDLAWAELCGALAGPRSYLRARRWLRERLAMPVAPVPPVLAPAKPLPEPERSLAVGEAIVVTACQKAEVS
jgi:GT2 family glycosyltransferase